MIVALRRIACAAALTLGMGGSAWAATADYSGLVAFGDSLTDKGHAYELSLGQIPESPPYFKGRFSDGPIWYDHVARAFRDEGLKTRNMAFGGARARTNLDPIPDLWLQRRTFLDRGAPDPDMLAAFFIGGNDLLDRVGRSSIRRVAREAAGEVIDAADSLRRNGVGTALIFSMPNLADIPRYANASDGKRRSATRGSVKYNKRLSRGVDELRDKGMKVIEVDTFGLFADVVARPDAYGITNLTRGCLKNGRNRCSEEEAAASAFADSIHPSATLHAILGAHVLDLLNPSASAIRVAGPVPAPDAIRSSAATIAPVPLPAPVALLAAALAGLGLVARRRGGRPRQAA